MGRGLAVIMSYLIVTLLIYATIIVVQTIKGTVLANKSRKPSSVYEIIKISKRLYYIRHLKESDIDDRERAI